MEHDGRVFPLAIKQLTIMRCNHCNNQTLPEASFDLLINALREAAGLLKPDEIKSQRETLQLSQNELATLLEVPPATVSRWETGGQVQQRAMNTLLTSFFAVPELRSSLMTKHGMLNANRQVSVSGSTLEVQNRERELAIQ